MSLACASVLTSDEVWFEYMSTASIILGAAVFRRLAVRHPSLLRRSPTAAAQLAGLSTPSPDR
jgi:hypothetical protein